VRSARDYFIDFALDYDSFFVHHGGSPSSYERLRSLRNDRMDGMTLEGICFRRDRTYPDWFTYNTGTRPLEHSSYTNSAGLRMVMADRNFRTEWAADKQYGFTFSAVDEAAYRRVGTAEYITVPFSPNYTRMFTFNPETLIYAVSNRHGPHVDAENGETVEVRNIIVQQVKTHIIPGDSEGRRHVQTVGSGEGYLIRDGFYEYIKWEKNSHTEPIRWFFLDGEPMKVSVGRTWVCVFGEQGTVDFGKEIINE
jgi:hypothetical protein